MTALRMISADETDKIFYSNAAKLYRIDLN